MRVIAGEFRGRILDSPSADTTRPTTDRVRESLFSSLYSRTGGFDGLSVLDAFAGSGALGIEALSRGASHAVFFERDPAAVRVLESNLAALSLAAPSRSSSQPRGSFPSCNSSQPRNSSRPAGSSRARVCELDVFSAAAAAPLAAGAPYDLVLLDPPYATPAADTAALLATLAATGSLADAAVISWEHAAADDPAALVADVLRDTALTPDGTRAYGTIAVTYLLHAAS